MRVYPETQDPMANNSSSSLSTGLIDSTRPLPGQVASRGGALRHATPPARGPPVLTTISATAPRVTPRSQAGQRLRRFVFTLNNYTEAEEASLRLLDCQYVCFGHEVGENGTRHLQGFVMLGKQLAFTTIKRLPGLTRAHIENMRGNFEQNFVYCTKQDATGFFEKGERPQPGKRNDLTTAVSLLKSGKTLHDIVMEEDVSVAATIARYPRGLQLVADMLTPPRREPPLVCWISGPTGVGKTRAAVELATNLGVDYWISHGNLQWFNGYRGQPVAILDDYRTRHAPFEFILRLLDRYRHEVPFKGGYVSWTPYVIILTAPKPPADMWSLRTSEDIAQLQRRVHLDASFPSDTGYEEILNQLSAAVIGRWPEHKPWEPDSDPSPRGTVDQTSVDEPLCDSGGDTGSCELLQDVSDALQDLGGSGSDSDAEDEAADEAGESSEEEDCSVSFGSCTTTEEF